MTPPLKTAVGLSWGDVEKGLRTAFPFVHQAGAGVLRAFGAGALVAPIEQLERRGGLLPAQQRPPADHIVRGADFAIVIYADGREPVAVTRPDVVGVWGGRLFGGNGYRGPQDFGDKFSFGYDAPRGVETTAQGRRAFFPDAKQVLLCGGTASDKQKIQGDVMSKGIIGTILGALGLDNDDYTVGAHYIGAVPNKYFVGAVALARPVKVKTKPPAAFGFQAKTSPTKGRSFTSLVTNRSRKRDPQKTLSQLSAVSQRAQQIAVTAVDRISKAEAAAAKAAKAPPKAAAKPPAKKSIVGAAAVARKLPRVAQMAAALPSLAQLKQKAMALSAAGQALKTHADKYKKTVDADSARRRSAQTNAQKITRIHGFGFEDNRWHEVVGHYEIGWEEITAACDAADTEFIEHVLGWDEVVGATPDPNNPGFNVDGTLIQPQPGDQPDPTYPGFLMPSGAIDPNGQYAAYAQQAGSGASGASLAANLPGPPNYGAGNPPVLQGNKIVLSDGSIWPQPGIDYMPDPYPNGDDPTFYDAPTDDDLPLGAVIFDGSRVPDFKALGNYTVFYEQVPGAKEAKGGSAGGFANGSGYSLHNDGWWFELQGEGGGWKGGRSFGKANEPSSAMIFESQKNSWGPLIGNPRVYQPNTKSWGGRAWTHGLRFSPTGPNGPRWFWFYDQAPDWAVTGMLQAQLNDFIAAFKAAVVAGQTDYVNAQLQDKLNAQAAAEAARQQAQQDAQLQMQQRAADQQAAQAQAQADQQARQLELQQQAYQQQAYQQQAQLQAQQQAQVQQANQMQLDYFAQHPEAMFTTDQGAAQPQQPQGGYGDAGYEGDGGDFGGGGIVSDSAIDWGADQTLPDASEEDLMQDADYSFPMDE